MHACTILFNIQACIVLVRHMSILRHECESFMSVQCLKIDHNLDQNTGHNLNQNTGHNLNQGSWPKGDIVPLEILFLPSAPVKVHGLVLFVIQKR